MTARTHRHGLAVNRSKGGFGGIPHGAWCVVHWPKKHTREGQRHIVLWLRFSAPLAPLHPAYAFGVDQVRPGASHDRGLLISVKIHQHVTLRSFAAHAMKVVDH